MMDPNGVKVEVMDPNGVKVELNFAAEEAARIEAEIAASQLPE